MADIETAIKKINDYLVSDLTDAEIEILERLFAKMDNKIRENYKY